MLSEGLANRCQAFGKRGDLSDLGMDGHRPRSGVRVGGVPVVGRKRGGPGDGAPVRPRDAGRGGGLQVDG